jgi:peptide/nickel transport system permease protein
MLGYIARRLLQLIPMWFFLSAVIFFLVELPPGDYVSTQVANLLASGLTFEDDQIQFLVETYGLDQPVYTRYGKWIWNAVIHGELGRSFAFEKPNGEIVKDRLPLTLALSFSSLVVSYAIAIPIGIYSATHQYSVFDYLFTFFGFFGLGTPGWLIAILGAWISFTVFDFLPVGLQSHEYIGAPLSWPVILDVLKRIWFPIVLTGLTTTGGTIRVMRNNLLDQLRQQYVTTARAKGLSERKLLLKYPVRLAINPLVSSLGMQFPFLIVGGGIIAIVLGLPTLMPVMNTAIMMQDMYLAGTILLIFTTFVLIGSLVADILLAVVDPRIRFGGGAR